MADLLDFTIEFNSDELDERTEQALFVEADTRLRALASNHDDLRGAAINMRAPAPGQTTPLHEATVVVYARPKQIAATEKHYDATVALKGALSAVERQVREKRAKRGRPWEQPGKGRAAQEMKTVEAPPVEDTLPG